MENWFAGFAERYPVFPGLMEAAIESAGTGLRPRPLSREGGDCRRIRRGRPRCRPGHGFSRNLLTGGHIGPPLRGVGRSSEPTEIGAKRCLSLRGGTEPAPYGSNRAGRSTAGCAWGVASASQIPKRNLGRQSWSPRLTEATQVVPSEGPMYLRHGFRQPNFVPKFRASVMGVGPYAPRGDEGRHAVPRAWPPPTKFRDGIWGVGQVVVPYGWLRRVAAIARASGAQRSVCGAVARGG